MTNKDEKITDKEIVEYFYKYIRTDTKFIERDGGFYYEVKDCEDIDYAQHSGSDILTMSHEVKKHKNENKKPKSGSYNRDDFSSYGDVDEY